MEPRPKQIAQEGAVSSQVLAWDGTKWAPADTSLLLGSVTGEPTGFPNRTDSTISKVDGTRTFTVQPAVTSFDFYIAGKKYTKNAAQNIVWPNSEGIHFFFFDANGVLQTTQVWNDALILSYALVAILYWDATNSTSLLFCDERHGIVMDGQSHLHMHYSLRCQWRSGLALQNIVADGDGSSDTHAQFSVQDGAVRDEDLQFDIADGSPQDLAPIAQIPVLWRSGASGVWRKKAADNFPLIWSTGIYTTPGGRIPYNQWTGVTWQLTELGLNELCLLHYWGTNNQAEPIVAILGQQVYTNITNARLSAATEIKSLVLTGLPTPEFKPLGSVIFQTSQNYGNTPKARIRSTDLAGVLYVDYRYSLFV